MVASWRCRPDVPLTLGALEELPLPRPPPWSVMAASPPPRTSAARWATFDCYGTLIDWNLGIRSELERIFGVERAPRLLQRYHELEPELESEPFRSYHEVLTLALERLPQDEQIQIPEGEAGALAQLAAGLAAVSRGARGARRAP